MRKITLQTPRLELRTLPPSYAGKTLIFYDKNRLFFEPYEPKREPYFYTRQHQKQLLKWDQQKLYESSMVRFWLFLKKDSLDEDIPIGTIAISNIVRGVFQSCHLGYKIDFDFTRQGYMTEALLKVLDYVFEDMNLHRIEANIMPSNAASIALVQKLDFHEEGLARQYLKINGKWEDHIHMVLLNDDY